MIARTAHRFTVDEYYKMAETGLIKPDTRVELLDGQIIDMAPIGPFHGGTVKSLIELFSDCAKRLGARTRFVKPAAAALPCLPEGRLKFGHVGTISNRRSLWADCSLLISHRSLT